MDDKTSEVLNYLYRQYYDSIGNKIYSDFNNEDNDEGFVEWLQEIKRLVSVYSYWLEELDVDTRSAKNVEINKSFFDGIDNLRIKKVTPFASMRNTFPSKLLYNMYPIIQTNDYCEPATNIKEFITHNPYSEEYVSVLRHLHNHDYPICLSVIGKINDKDYLKKCDYLVSFASNLKQGYKLNYAEDSGLYFYTLQSDFTDREEQSTLNNKSNINDSNIIRLNLTKK